jgi:predicted Fe-Mo cluster-binding NifX family protein
MKICFPVSEDRGLDSPICEHFGSSPFFLFVDAETGEGTTVPNRNEHHEHGRCQPLRALQSQPVDGVVVAGIGRGALLQLQGGGISVFLSRHSTVRESLEALRAGSLPQFEPSDSCGGHGHGDAHQHRHGTLAQNP